MMMLESLYHVLEGIAVIQSFYQIEEIKSGKTTNKVYLTLQQWLLNFFSLQPLFDLFPNSTIGLNILNASLSGLILLTNYICYVFETNQIIDSGAINGVKKTLPFGLENSTSLKHMAKYFSEYISWVEMLVYIVAIGFAATHGMPYFALYHALGFLVEQMYQRNILPTVLAKTYRLLVGILVGGYIFGFGNWVLVSLATLNIIVTLVDYVLTHVLGITSATVQFPISTKANTFSFEENGMSKPNNKPELNQLLSHLLLSDTELTFNHMRQSSLLIEQLSQDVQDVNYEDYLSLFDRLDYKNKEFQALIEAEITANDDFIQKTPEELIQSLELPSNATLYEIKIAYLKQQMGFMVERLKSNAAHNLRAAQVLLLKGQARLILMHLNTLEPWQYAEFNRILITLTLCTGSRCSRAYLECFAGILRDNSIIQGREQLSFTERVIVQTQKIKSKAFMNYYYNLTGVVKKSCKSTNNPFGENVGVLFWADSQDYHSYEDFALQFGPFFYLDNTSLSCRMRGILDLFPDAYVAYNSKEMPQISFNYYYNESVLIDEVINGELSADFVKWCNTFYPHAYEDFCLDDEFMPYPKHDLKMRALARLMLLDCHIIQFREPCSLILAHEKQQHHHIRFSYGM